MSFICEDHEEPCHSKPGRILKEYGSRVLAGYQALELRKPLLDLQQLLDDDDVGLLGVDPYGAVFAGDQLFDLTVVRCGNLRIHVGNDTRDPHQLLELAEREAIMAIDATHPYVPAIGQALKDTQNLQTRCRIVSMTASGAI